MRYVTKEHVFKALNGNTRSVQNWGHFLGQSPERLGLAAELYPEHTAMQLLDRLFNIHKLPKEKQFQSIKQNCFTWQIKTNKIKQVQIARPVTTDGRQGTPVTIVLQENYFHPNDTLVINESRDVLFVNSPATQIGPREFQYTCRLVTTNLNEGLDLSKAVPGNSVRFRSTHFPEASEKRYTRYQSDIEFHRNYLTLHGVQENKTGSYALMEQTFIEASVAGKTMYFDMQPIEKHCYDQFMMIRNNNLLFGKSNHDSNGRCLIQTADGRDIPMGKFHCPLAA